MLLTVKHAPTKIKTSVCTVQMGFTNKRMPLVSLVLSIVSLERCVINIMVPVQMVVLPTGLE